MLVKFLVYGSIGWIVEVIWTGFGSLLNLNLKLSSHTYLWMFFIYGCAIFLEPLHDRIRSWNWFFRGTLYMLAILAIEYISGWFLHSTIGVCPWDYSGTPYSINGYIRLDYAPVWFVAGLIFERIHDTLNFVLRKLEYL